MSRSLNPEGKLEGNLKQLVRGRTMSDTRSVDH